MYNNIVINELDNNDISTQTQNKTNRYEKIRKTKEWAYRVVKWVWLKFIKIRRRNMENLFLTVDEVRQLLGVSKSYAYKVIRKMNSELRQQGYHTIAGRVSKTYFLEKVKYQKLERSK